MSLLTVVHGRGTTAAKPAAAAANEGYLYQDTTLGRLERSNGVTWDVIGGTTGGVVATDTIWDAKGDLAGGTGADAAARLAVGADDTILMADAAQATGLKWVASATPSTQAFGDAAAVGTADTFTRGDHKHAMPTYVPFHGCSVYRSSTEVSTTVLAFNAELYDSDAYHDNATNPSRVTIPSGLGGYYLIEMGTSTTFTFSGTNGLRIRKNGATNISTNFYVETQGYVRGLCVAQLAATDYIEVQNFTGVSATFGHASAYEAQERLTVSLLGV